MTSPNEIKTVEEAAKELHLRAMLFEDMPKDEVRGVAFHRAASAILTALLKHAQSEIEKKKRIVFPGDSEQFKAPLHSANTAKDEDIGILEAMIRGV
jgi:hypothetical protein